MKTKVLVFRGLKSQEVAHFDLISAATMTKGKKDVPYTTIEDLELGNVFNLHQPGHASLSIFITKCHPKVGV